MYRHEDAVLCEQQRKRLRDQEGIEFVEPNESAIWQFPIAFYCVATMATPPCGGCTTR